jgi:hypothetical protein
MRLPSIARRALLSVLLAGVTFCASSSEDVMREWRFAVSLDGKPIGEHRFVLRERDGLRELTSEASFRVRFLFMNAYRYEHRANEVWRGDCLERLDARTDENGDEIVVSGERAERGFRVTTDGAVAGIEPCVQTFAYWNPSILDASRLLNPQTGEYLPVQVIALGPESAGQHRDAQRYRLLGDAGGQPLQIDLWYSAASEWLALESRTPDGRRLSYSKN